MAPVTLTFHRFMDKEPENGQYIFVWDALPDDDDKYVVDQTPFYAEFRTYPEGGSELVAETFTSSVYPYSLWCPVEAINALASNREVEAR